ncbi:MAG TPA: CBS domain-containing protein, partial [Halothiobacillaceae bacterium]|nr:CBS domain-containing protein [Halothiobacillaceae bacterium]
MGHDRRDDTDRRDAIAALREVAPFDRIDPDLLGRVMAEARIRSLDEGEVLLEPGMGPPTSFYVVLSGRVDGLVDSQAVSRADSSADSPGGQPVWSLGRGDAFPLGALTENRPVGTIQRVGAAGEVIVVPAAAFRQLREASAVFDDFCTRRIGHLLARGPAEPLRLDGDTPLSQAARALERHGGDAIVVRLDDGWGIATLRDLAFRGLAGGEHLRLTLADVATCNPVGIDAGTSLLEAAVDFAEHGFHHLLVTEIDRDEPLGVIDESSLYRVNAMTPGVLHQRIRKAGAVESLVAVRRDIPDIVGALLESGSNFASISRIVSGLNDAITRRVIALTFEDAPLPADMEWCWLTFGSEARAEQTLATDQDNGLVFAGPMDDQAARDQLLPLARRVNEALDQLGYPLCPGHIMAGNPELCLSLDEWGEHMRAWIDQGTPEHLLKASIFFDARGLAGSRGLFDRWAAAWREPARKNGRFRRQLAANALR